MGEGVWCSYYFQKDLGEDRVKQIFCEIHGKHEAYPGNTKDMPVVLRTELEGDAHYAFKAVGVKIPPRLLSDPSDIQETVVIHV